MSIVTDFFDKHDISYKQIPGGECVLNPCPVCGTDKGKFYVNATKGLYDCKICGTKGNFFKLKSLFGVVDEISSVKGLVGEEFKPLEMSRIDTYEQALWSNPAALEYIRSRGLSDETIKHFRLGYVKEGDGDWIAIPHMQQGKLWNFKFRRFAGGEKTFKRITGQPTVLYNMDGVNLQKKTICIVESETDCMAAWQMGITNVVGFTGGAKTFKPEWLQIFTHFSTVYIILNNDEVGQQGARKVAEKIGLAKCKNVILPVKDVNDYMQNPAYTSDTLKSLIVGGTQFNVESIMTMPDIVSKLDEWFDGNGGGVVGLDTGFPQLDALTGGQKAQDLIILSGDSGIGKTTYCLNQINHHLQYGRPVLAFFLEGQVPYYLTRMMSIETRVPYLNLRDNKDVWTDIKKDFSDLPLYVFNGSAGGLTPETIKEIISTAVNLYDVKYVMIDNLQKAVRGADTMYFQRVGDMVSALKDIAVEYNIPVVLISHITKTDPNKKLITKHDAKASSTIYQDADQFLIVQKIKEEYNLSIDKNRMGEDGIHIKMLFNKELGLFVETDDAPVKTEDVKTGVPMTKTP